MTCLVNGPHTYVNILSVDVGSQLVLILGNMTFGVLFMDGELLCQTWCL